MYRKNVHAHEERKQSLLHAKDSLPFQLHLHLNSGFVSLGCERRAQDAGSYSAQGTEAVAPFALFQWQLASPFTKQREEEKKVSRRIAWFASTCDSFSSIGARIVEGIHVNSARGHIQL